MKSTFLFTGIGLVSLLLILTSFSMTKNKLFARKAAVVAVIVINHSHTVGRNIIYAQVGPYTYTSLSIPPGGSQTFYEIDFGGAITVSVGCSSAWIGTVAYCEVEDYNTIGCNTKGTGSVHSLTCTASPSVRHIAEIFDTTYECL